MRNPAAFAISIANLRLADAEMVRRRALMPVWTCQQCGKQEAGTVHRRRNKYCSNACVSVAYTGKLTGKNNPNFRDLPPKTCLYCKCDFTTYNSDRKYCSHACYAAHSATEEQKKLRNAYRGGHKDKNHDQMVSVFEQMGCSVLETHTMGGGFPDLVLGLIGQTILVEVKNPETGYGRKGLSESQRKMSDAWRGSKVNVVSTEDEAIDLIQRVRGRFEQQGAGNG